MRTEKRFRLKVSRAGGEDWVMEFAAAEEDVVALAKLANTAVWPPTYQGAEITEVVDESDTPAVDESDTPAVAMEASP